jgi:DNA-directed RNA polymerase subunit K/omega|tara:strand:- start:2667 stop:2996 length:330 start_codon:yes stop_codon:yes gene_type:complete
MKIKSKITNLNVDEIASKTGNIYKSVRIIGKRARQLSATQKEELNEKLAEFASDVDNLEEVFENREQIEISRYFERLPKSTTVASEELVNDELFFRNPEEEEEEDLNLD